MFLQRLPKKDPSERKEPEPNPAPPTTGMKGKVIAFKQPPVSTLGRSQSKAETSTQPSAATLGRNQSATNPVPVTTMGRSISKAEIVNPPTGRNIMESPRFAKLGRSVSDAPSSSTSYADVAVVAPPNFERAASGDSEKPESVSKVASKFNLANVPIMTMPRSISKSDATAAQKTPASEPKTDTVPTPAPARAVKRPQLSSQTLASANKTLSQEDAGWC